MKQIPADQITTETSRGSSTTTVYGPYESDYGRPQFGSVTRERAGRFIARGANGNVIGPFSKKAAAVAAVVGWASENLTAESISRDFEDVTAGGIKLTFRRRVFTSNGPVIVASYRDGVRTALTTWGADGISESYRDDRTPAGRKARDKFMLVRRKPEPVSSADGGTPAP